MGVNDDESWNEYGKLVLNQLERLNDNYEKMKNDMDSRFSELNIKISEFKNTEGKVSTLVNWRDNVIDVWSVQQMKEAKDEVYKQKSRWTAAIAILLFIQIVTGAIIGVLAYLK